MEKEVSARFPHDCDHDAEQEAIEEAIRQKHFDGDCADPCDYCQLDRERADEASGG